ncbi:MAG: hypothetical protein Q8S42_15480, partial [Archangium sp.]|nr:hypothetical protein [Archangium sp.]
MRALGFHAHAGRLSCDQQGRFFFVFLAARFGLVGEASLIVGAGVLRRAELAFAGVKLFLFRSLVGFRATATRFVFLAFALGCARLLFFCQPRGFSGHPGLLFGREADLRCSGQERFFFFRLTRFFGDRFHTRLLFSREPRFFSCDARLLFGETRLFFGGQSSLLLSGEPGLFFCSQPGLLLSGEPSLFCSQPGLLLSGEPSLFCSQPGLLFCGEPGLLLSGEPSLFFCSQPGLFFCGETGLFFCGEPGLFFCGEPGLFFCG